MWYCYILRNIHPPDNRKTYNGMTNDPRHRLRQHNGELVGGAKYTSRFGNKSWEMYAVLGGLPDKSSCLQCEWRIKHPNNRRKRPRKYCGPVGRIKGLNEVIHLEQWTRNSMTKCADCNLTLWIAQEFAHLIEKYMADGGAAGIMGPEPALHRVVPAHGTVKTEWILPYDDVRAILLAAKTFRVNDCICRVQQKLVGKGCDHSVDNCMAFAPREGLFGGGSHIRAISKQDALKILEDAAQEGLVHSTGNYRDGNFHICNCCACCWYPTLGGIHAGFDKTWPRVYHVAERPARSTTASLPASDC